MRGRKPKPAAVRIAEGDTRKVGVHKLEAQLAGEPQTVRGLPPCPDHLEGRAAEAWAFWVAELEFMGIDSRPDAMMLEGACVNYARAVESDRILRDEGLLVKESTVDDDSGEVIVLKIRNHPAVSISNAAWRQVRAFCSEFGLSPVSRTRLSIEKRDSEQDLMTLLSRPREPRPVVN